MSKGKRYRKESEDTTTKKKREKRAEVRFR